MSPPLLLVDGLRKTYGPGRGPVGPGGPPAAVADVSFAVARGETLALVGESGAGKSTIARCLVRLDEPDAGRIRFDGAEIAHLRGRALRGFRRRVQIVFQDPHGSLNPRMRVGAAVREPLEVHRLARGAEADARVGALFAEVGLDPDYRTRFPHELSGGQRQRVGIARALAVGPDLLVLDEPVSALDVSVQAQVLALLRDLQERRSLTYLFIAHDLAVVRQMADRIAVLYRGRIVEEAPTARLLADPRHPYTQTLLSAVPRIEVDARRARLRLRLPDGSAAAGGGCPFAPRCPDPRRNERCGRDFPPMLAVAPSHRAACHFAEEPLV
jgi:oligopeptide/dipeptide ABC transporter ATP-binding protein